VLWIGSYNWLEFILKIIARS